MTDNIRTLEQQKEEFKQKKLLASPIAGLIAWLTVAISGLLFPDKVTVWVLFIATGSIVYLAMGISKFTGENYLDKNKPKNTFEYFFCGAYYIYQEGHTIGLHESVAVRIYRIFCFICRSGLSSDQNILRPTMEGGECEPEKGLLFCFLCFYHPAIGFQRRLRQAVS